MSNQKLKDYKEILNTTVFTGECCCDITPLYQLSYMFFSTNPYIKYVTAEIGTHGKITIKGWETKPHYYVRTDVWKSYRDPILYCVCKESIYYSETTDTRELYFEREYFEDESK